jgi:hypothetical protein
VIEWGIMRWSAFSPRRAGGTLAAALVLLPLVFAQPRGRPGSRSTPKPRASSDGAAEGDRSPAPTASTTAVASGTAAPASSVSDLGPVPAPPGEWGDGGKLSPLNPAPGEFSDAGAPATSFDYDRLLADIGSLRARVAAVSDTLFHSRISVSLETSGDHARIASLTVSLDDGVVWTSPASFRAENATTVYDHAVAPGHHAVTIDVERRDDRNDAFRSAQRSRFVVDVPTDQRLGVELALQDDSNMGGDFPADRKGRYELRVRLRARAQAIGR